MSSSDNIQFITFPEDHINMPCLQNMFDKIETMIADGLKEHPGMDEVELRRRLAGKVCWNDLAHLERHFKKATLVEKKPMSLWNEVVREVSSTKNDFNFRTDMSAVKRKYEEIRSNPETISAYEEKLQRENLQRENTMKAKNQETGVRMEAYRIAHRNLKEMAKSMLINFNSHIIVHVYCDVEKQFDYPPFTYSNSALSRTANEKLEKAYGDFSVNIIRKLCYSKPRDTSKKSPVFDGNQTYNQARTNFRQIASEKWSIFKNKSRNIPWKRLFFDANYDNEIVGWPIEGKLKLPFENNEKVDFDLYRTEQLLELAKYFYEGKIYFRKKQE